MDPFAGLEYLVCNLSTFMVEFFGNSPRTWEESESKQEAGKDLPQLQDNHVQFGDNPDESFAIYTRIEQPKDLFEVTTPSHHRTLSARILNIIFLFRL